MSGWKTKLSEERRGEARKRRGTALTRKDVFKLENGNFLCSKIVTS
jgi:hypothetical protein